MEQCPSWKANSSVASLTIPYILWNQMVHYCLHKSLPLFHILNHADLAHALPTESFKVKFSIVLQSTVLVFRVISFRQISQLEPYWHIFFLPYMLRALPVSFFLFWSSEQYPRTVRSTKKEATHFIFSSSPLFTLSHLGCTLFSEYPQPMFLPQCETKFHTHTKQQTKL